MIDDDIVKLAQDVAKELRKRGIWAKGSNVTILIPNTNPGDLLRWRLYAVRFGEFDNLNHIEIADEIQRQESKRAREWAGDD